MTKTFDEILGDAPDCDLTWRRPDADLEIGYGADAIEITDDDLERLRDGAILELHAQGEYAMYVRLKRNDA